MTSATRRTSFRHHVFESASGQLGQSNPLQPNGSRQISPRCYPMRARRRCRHHSLDRRWVPPGLAPSGGNTVGHQPIGNRLKRSSLGALGDVSAKGRNSVPARMAETQCDKTEIGARRRSTQQPPYAYFVEFEVVDLTSWTRGEREPGGDEEKRWFDAPAGTPFEGHWLFKPRRVVELELSKKRRELGDEPDILVRGEDWAEKIAYEMSRLIDLPAAITELAQTVRRTDGVLATVR
jgi:hypothetical protein